MWGTPYAYQEAILAVFGCHVEKMEGNEIVFKKDRLGETIFNG